MTAPARILSAPVRVVRSPRRVATALSVVVPAFDEGDVIAATIDRLVLELERRVPSFELVLVDDGSRDGTGAILDGAASRDPRIRALSHARNRGKGAAVRTGVLACQGELVLVMDADLSTGLDAIPRAIYALRRGADVVFGSRRALGARIVRRQSRSREWLGRGFSRIARILAPGTRDFTCGFKGYRRRAARALFRRGRTGGWAFDVELAVIARTLRMRLEELPVEWTDAPATKVRIPRAILGSLLELAGIAWRRVRGGYALDRFGRSWPKG